MLSLISMPSPFGGIGFRGFIGPKIRGPGGIRVATAGDAGTGAASYGTAAVGPEENTEVVTFGLVTARSPDGAPVVIGIRDESQFGPPFCIVEILAADRSAATATRDEIERLIRAHDVFRGQVLSFTESEHHGNQLGSLLPRPAVPAPAARLPDGGAESIQHRT